MGNVSSSATSDLELRIDQDSRRVWLGGDLIELTRMEFDLLVALSENPHRVLSRIQLLEELWETSSIDDGRPIEVYIHRLRHKLGESATDPRYIQTVRGVGYRFEPTDESTPNCIQVRYDATGTIQQVSPEIDSALGWSREEIIGERFMFGARAPFSSRRFIAFVNSLASRLGLVQFLLETTVFWKSGRPQPVVVNVTFLREDGDISGVEAEISWAA